MKKIYTLFFCLFMFAGVTAFAQSTDDVTALAKRKSNELVVALDMNKEQRVQLTEAVKVFELNKLDNDYQTPSVYPNSKFTLMRENYSGELLVKLKEILTDDQYTLLQDYL